MFINSPVYYWHEEDGYYVCIDGRPDYFRTRGEMYAFACADGRDVIEVTDDNDQTLRDSGAFDSDGEF
ncbi:hypothetical protein BOO91_15885 [Vibrio navarrensis]|uniref:Uncharacterized protein n=1 Tax=Vibrio navarrensis TaxID=29495 RepID=A0AAI9G860_9VIBR|nr:MULTISPECIES: hypothetical protein [Vibrio]ELN6932062.1 hypothetical protein [Vibrio navarrensis]MBE3662417.1 hypothetical protein [Vibrio navarrensis]MBE4602150.1 hypothetical protein [Vibrio navarrensis]MBG0757604.1 hypothetical protein [Vibrio cidicii]MBG0758700.1 hypothetical protein [Vibrio cidicii]